MTLLISLLELLFETFKILATHKCGWLLDIAILVSIVSIIELLCKLLSNVVVNLCKLIGGIFDWFYKFSIMHKAVRQYQKVIQESNMSYDDKIVSMKYLLAEIQDSLNDDDLIKQILFRDLIDNEKNKEKEKSKNESRDTGESTD